MTELTFKMESRVFCQPTAVQSFCRPPDDRGVCAAYLYNLLVPPRLCARLSPCRLGPLTCTRPDLCATGTACQTDQEQESLPPPSHHHHNHTHIQTVRKPCLHPNLTHLLAPLPPPSAPATDARQCTSSTPQATHWLKEGLCRCPQSRAAATHRSTFVSKQGGCRPSVESVTMQTCMCPQPLILPQEERQATKNLRGFKRSVRAGRDQTAQHALCSSFFACLAALEVAACQQANRWGAAGRRPIIAAAASRPPAVPSSVQSAVIFFVWGIPSLFGS